MIEQSLTNRILFKLDREDLSLYYINRKMSFLEEMMPSIEDLESWLNVTHSVEPVLSNAIEILHET